MVRVLAVSGLLLFSGLLFTQFSGVVLPPKTPYPVGNVNLALRRTADRLLRAGGDSTSRIPAVQQANPQTFRIQLGRTFDYERLPRLLQESFQLHRITAAYDVAVLDCATGTLQLGYTVSDLLNDHIVPCVGRSRTAGCYVLQVTFAAASPADQPGTRWPILTLGGLLTCLVVVVWYRKKTSQPIPEQLPLSDPPASLELHFGRSFLDVTNQTLITDSHQHNLTYREAKLLRLLVNHPNQLLERDQILKLVWEDEGVTVGRSVDVFMSRLRKLLHDDPTVKIVAVHGVGYRLEIQSQRTANGQLSETLKNGG